MANLIGQTLGQYHVTVLLGKGGMAAVYRARQASVNRDVAIKVIKPDLVESEEFKVRFSREAQVIAALSHPHILKVFDYGQHGDVVYLVMELLNGGSLADLLRKGGRLPLTEVTRLLEQIGGALDYAHRRAIVHRDLKPQNVLLDEEGNAFLTDFGIAKLLGETSGLTQSGTAMGTPAYMSPEQWRGQNVDGRADIYALGVMLYEMLAGRVPFMGDTPYSMMHMHVFEALPSIRMARPDLPEAVQGVLAKSMAKDRDERFSTAGEMVNVFKAALSETAASGAASPSVDVTAPVPVGGLTLDAPTIQAASPSTSGQVATSQGAAPLGLSAESRRKPANRLPLLLGVAIVVLSGVLLALLRLGDDQGATLVQATLTETSTNTPTDAPTVTLTPSNSPSPEPTLTATPTASNTPSPEPTQIAAIVTEPPTATHTAAATLTPAITATPTATLSAARTPTPTPTPNLAATERANALNTARAQVDIQRTEARATLTAAAATLQAEQTRFAQLQIELQATRTARAIRLQAQRTEARATITAAAATLQARQTEARATVTTGAATLQAEQTRLARLRTARAEFLTATALARPTQTPNLTATAFFAGVNATLAAQATAQAQQTALAKLYLTGTARAAKSTAAAALLQPSGRLIFHTDLNGRWEINQVTLPGGEISRLTDGRGVYYLPSFSADGQLIVLSSARAGPVEIFVVRADGSELRRLTVQGGENWGAAISPDNQRVVWHSNRPGTFRLFIANLDGTGIRQLTQRDPASSSLDADGSWAPDGKRIVFASSRSPRGLYFIDVETGALTYFSAAGQDAEDPAWSPDGSRIAFQSKRDGNLEIYVINADGTGLRRLTNHPAADGRPAWSPDGQWLAFESDRDGKLDIYIMRADGSDVRRVTSGPGKNGWPSWAR
ncbi:MAG: protein kinase [Aggregatilineales bacterium]